MTTKKQPDLNQAFKQLETIVAQFEAGEVELEQSISRFEEGLKLAQFLKQRLKKIENQMIELKQQYDEEA